MSPRTAATLVGIFIDIDLMSAWIIYLSDTEHLAAERSYCGQRYEPSRSIGDFLGFIGLDLANVVPSRRQSLQRINFTAGLL